MKNSVKVIVCSLFFLNIAQAAPLSGDELIRFLLTEQKSCLMHLAQNFWTAFETFDEKPESRPQFKLGSDDLGAFPDVGYVDLNSAEIGSGLKSACETVNGQCQRALQLLLKAQQAEAALKAVNPTESSEWKILVKEESQLLAEFRREAETLQSEADSLRRDVESYETWKTSNLSTYRSHETEFNQAAKAAKAAYELYDKRIKEYNTAALEANARANHYVKFKDQIASSQQWAAATYGSWYQPEQEYKRQEAKLKDYKSKLESLATQINEKNSSISTRVSAFQYRKEALQTSQQQRKDLLDKRVSHVTETLISKAQPLKEAYERSIQTLIQEFNPPVVFIEIMNKGAEGGLDTHASTVLKSLKDNGCSGTGCDQVVASVRRIADLIAKNEQNRAQAQIELNKKVSRINAFQEKLRAGGDELKTFLDGKGESLEPKHGVFLGDLAIQAGLLNELLLRVALELNSVQPSDSQLLKLFGRLQNLCGKSSDVSPTQTSLDVWLNGQSSLSSS